MKKLFLVLLTSGVMIASANAQDKKAAVAKQTLAPAKAAVAAPVKAATSAPATVNIPAQQIATPAGAPTTPQPAANPNAAELKFKIEKHDFGTVPEGPQAKFDFEFTNDGKEPLILSNVQASCGCTTPEWPKEPILPGKSAKVTAIYNTQGRPGQFTKSITVSSNAKTPSVVLMISGTVEKAPATTAPEKTPNSINVTPTPAGH
ncbi:MAG: hypothetical protein RI955_1566 [Bacteroidota bacterium]|jgi:hypothetical protein